jgi:hypothetical protein
MAIIGQHKGFVLRVKNTAPCDRHMGSKATKVATSFSNGDRRGLCSFTKEFVPSNRRSPPKRHSHSFVSTLVIVDD